MLRRMMVSAGAILTAFPAPGLAADQGQVADAARITEAVDAGAATEASQAANGVLAGDFDVLSPNGLTPEEDAERRAFLTAKGKTARAPRFVSVARTSVIASATTAQSRPEAPADPGSFGSGCAPLDTVMARAVDYDPRITTAVADAQIAGAEELAAFSRFLPQVALSAQTGLGDTPPLDTRADDQVALILNQELFSFGSRWYGYKAARLVHDASDYGIQDQRNQIAAGAASAYLDYARTAELAALAREQADTFRDDAESAASRLSRRVITLTDASQIRARYARAQSDTITAEVEEARAAVRLDSLTGQQIPCIVPTSIDTVLQEDADAILAVPVETAVDLALLSSPALIRQRLRVEAAKASVKEARRGHLPTISLNSFYRGANIESNIPGVGIENDFQEDTRVGFALEQQIFTGGRIKAQRDNAKGRLLRAEAERDLERLSTTDEIRRGLAAARAAREAGLALQDARDQARIQIDSTVREYDRRTKTLTDLVLATEAYYIAASQEVRARYEYYRALISLYAAMGLLVDYESD